MQHPAESNLGPASLGAYFLLSTLRFSRLYLAAELARKNVMRHGKRLEFVIVRPRILRSYVDRPTDHFSKISFRRIALGRICGAEK